MSSALTPSPAAMPHLSLSDVLQIIENAAALAALVAPLTGPVSPDVQAGARIAAATIAIIEKALAVHQQALGEPLDMAKLHQIPEIT